MNKNALIVIVVIIIAIVLGYAAMGRTTPSAQQQATTTDGMEGMDHSATSSASATSSNSTNPVATSTQAGAVKVFNITSDNFKFSASEIRVKQGDRVRIVLNNVEGFHDWKIDEFNAATRKIQGAGTDSVEFIASKKGTFEYYCSVGQHRQMGMRGNLIVE